MIGADWCPGCVKMKRSVLPAVAGLAKVQLSHIDVDEQPQLARQMLRGTSIPQLIVFSRSESGWKREHFVGPRSAADVEAAIARAVAIQAKAPKLASEETTTASRTE
jgi:thioredoxin-like negative regulator of GroEL